MCICSADEDKKFLLQTWHKSFGKPANTYTTPLQIKLLAFTKKSYVTALYAYFKFPFICIKYIYSIYREEKVGNK
jgi:hypothetical protein